ncbi:cilia- and flagella-associated protein 77 [Anolis sagrei]|uniref:cilia- and flagella-associated protein 77 n=1 Tax=Anolis sagrei TaxID=38937 RepID=UPI0035226D9D
MEKKKGPVERVPKERPRVEMPRPPRRIRRSASQICPPPRRPMTLAELTPGCENERLGVARDSMLQNPRIAKPEVGKPRRSCYTLPGYDFNYGLYLRGLDGGVPEAIGGWACAPVRVVPAKEKPRDYEASNARGVIAGFVRPLEQRLYNREKDLRLHRDDERRFKTGPPPVPPGVTYGRPARPSTPFFDLLQHKYKENWMEEQRALIKAEKAEKQQKKRRGRTYDTRTTILRRYQFPMDRDPLWTMTLFQKVSPHLSTFEDQASRLRSMTAFRSEVPVRIGPLGQGLYTTGW